MQHKLSAVTGVGAVLALLAAIARTGLCYVSGAPDTACLTMYPRHGTAERQIIPSRFAIVLTPDAYRSRDIISVTLYSLDGNSFRGFLMKATRETGDTERAVGTFVWFQENKTQVFTCEGGYKNTVTHTNNAPVKNVTLRWRAPEENIGNIVFRTGLPSKVSPLRNGLFSAATLGEPALRVRAVDQDVINRATVVEEFSTFWTGLLGNLKAATNDKVLPPEMPAGVEIKSDPTDLAVCGVAKGCFLYPRHCSDLDCIASASFWLDGDRYKFELSAQDASYVTIGFSEDETMGEDETVTCTAGDILSVQHGYNRGHENQRLPQSHLQHSQLFEKSVARINRRTSCSFSRSIATVVSIINQSAPLMQADDIKFNLSRSYYLMLAWGRVKKGTDVILKHETIPPVTDTKVVFGEHTVYRGCSLSLAVRVHVGLMSLAWILVAGLAVARPRYLKSWFNRSELSEERLWSQVHRASAIMLCLLTVFGILVILPNYKGVFSGLHGVLGLTVTGLLFLEILTGLCLPKLSSERRQLLSAEGPTNEGRQHMCREGHRLLGFITYVTAVASIYSGFYVSFIQKALCEYGELVVVLWITSQALWIVAIELRERFSEEPPNTIQHGQTRKESSRKVDAFLLTVYLVYLFVIWGFILSSVIIF